MLRRPIKEKHSDKYVSINFEIVLKSPTARWSPDCTNAQGGGVISFESCVRFFPIVESFGKVLRLSFIFPNCQKFCPKIFPIFKSFTQMLMVSSIKRWLQQSLCILIRIFLFDQNNQFTNCIVFSKIKPLSSILAFTVMVASRPTSRPTKQIFNISMGK